MQVRLEERLATMYLDAERYEEYLRESVLAADLQRHDAMRRIFMAAQRGHRARKSKERGETDIRAIRIDRSFKNLWQNDDFRVLAAEIGFPFPQTAGLLSQAVPR